MASLPNSASTFTCFPKLPAELRIKIWSLCFPRILQIQCAIRKQVQKDTSFTCRYTTYRSKQGMPALFSVSRESRQCALKNYLIIRDHFGPCFYFNPSVDILDVSMLCVEDWLLMVKNIPRSFPGGEVRSLAIAEHSLGADSNKILGSESVMLEELFIVLDDSSDFSLKRQRTEPVMEILKGDTSLWYPGGKHIPTWLAMDGLFKMLKNDDGSDFPSGRIPIVKAVSPDFWGTLSRSLRL